MAREMVAAGILHGKDQTGAIEFKHDLVVNSPVYDLSKQVVAFGARNSKSVAVSTEYNIDKATYIIYWEPTSL